jgi:hypothetical protein
MISSWTNPSAALVPLPAGSTCQPCCRRPLATPTTRSHTSPTRCVRHPHCAHVSTSYAAWRCVVTVPVLDLHPFFSLSKIQSARVIAPLPHFVSPLGRHLLLWRAATPPRPTAVLSADAWARAHLGHIRELHRATPTIPAKLPLFPPPSASRRRRAKAVAGVHAVVLPCQVPRCRLPPATPGFEQHYNYQCLRASCHRLLWSWRALHAPGRALKLVLLPVVSPSSRAAVPPRAQAEWASRLLSRALESSSSTAAPPSEPRWAAPSSSRRCWGTVCRTATAAALLLSRWPVAAAYFLVCSPAVHKPIRLWPT